MEIERVECVIRSETLSNIQFKLVFKFSHLSPSREPWFDLGPFHVRYMVRKVTLS